MHSAATRTSSMKLVASACRRPPPISQQPPLPFANCKSLPLTGDAIGPNLVLEFKGAHFATICDVMLSAFSAAAIINCSGVFSTNGFLRRCCKQCKFALPKLSVNDLHHFIGIFPLNLKMLATLPVRLRSCAEIISLWTPVSIEIWLLRRFAPGDGIGGVGGS